MNQAIQFPDLQHWDEEQRAVVFPAQQAGALIECIISAQGLAELAKTEVQNAQHALALFSELRFELEERAEAGIEDEEFNSQGQIELG